MNTIYKYDVALSFAGEDRAYVEEVALQLKGHGVRVFYDKFEEEKLWGKNLYDYLSDVYTVNAKYTIMFISNYYKDKLWTNHERESMQERAFQSAREYILPARFDDTVIPGIKSTTGYINIKNKTPNYLVNLVLKKIGWKLKKRWWGRWKIASVTTAHSSLLEIYDVNENGFMFNLSTLHGSHSGEVSGDAKFINDNEASFSSGEEDERCVLTFTKTIDVIQVDENSGCSRYGGMRAYFKGDYVLKKDSFYNLTIVNDIHLTSIYSILGDKNWNYYVNCFSDTHKPDVLDESGCKVVSGGMPGLYTICESILMINLESVWGAFLRDEKVYYFTNTNQRELPKTFLKWKENFNKKEVVFLS